MSFQRTAYAMLKKQIQHLKDAQQKLKASSQKAEAEEDEAEEEGEETRTRREELGRQISAQEGLIAVYEQHVDLSDAKTQLDTH